MHPNKLSTILITCERGLSEYLARELESLGYTPDSTHKTGVELKGRFEDTMQLNLRLRTAYNVMLRLMEFTCSSPDDLYRQLKEFPWESWIAPNEYLCVSSRVDTPTVDNSMFASLKVKDAVVDRIMQKSKRRPNSGARRDNVVLSLYWHGKKCRLFLNTSGQKMSDRGYRKLPHKAPLRESLAAAILMAMEYDGEHPLVCPMCGSGTLAIEAALIALDRAPGLLRSNVGLQHVLPYDESAWQLLRKKLRSQGKKNLPAPIIATDIDPQAVEAAQKNAKVSGVDHLIEFAVCDFADTPLPKEPGMIVMNPEYGERLGDTKELEAIYKRMGDWLKQKCAGYTGFIFTGNLDLAKKIGLRASRRFEFWNAKIDCRLLRYEMYKGREGQEAPAGD